MTTTGTGPCSTCPSTACRRSCRWCWWKVPGFSILENGEIILILNLLSKSQILSSGVHHKKSNCDSKAVSEKVKKIIKSAKTYFFPERWKKDNKIFWFKSHLKLLFYHIFYFRISVSKSRSRKKPKLKKANGGWGDVRDHQLCANFTRIHQWLWTYSGLFLDFLEKLKGVSIMWKCIQK